jgi:hypothetical protein
MDVRNVVGNGWGDGDFIQGMDRKEGERFSRSIYAFEKWMEAIGNFKFKMYTTRGGK